MQKEYIGSGSFEHLSSILEYHCAKKIFLVTGKHSYELCGAKKHMDKICADRQVLSFSNFSVNPKLEEAQEGIRLLSSFKADIVISIGGGSVLDMGKLVTFLQAQNSADHESIIHDTQSARKGLPFIAIPTTAGTGSESTRFAVVYINGIKYSLAHPFVVPDYAIVDPLLTLATPKYLAAASGMDALCQSIESFWSVNATVKSRSISKTAIQTLLPSLKECVLTNNLKAKEKVALGANLSGKAINLTETTAPHAISYALTSHYGISHGHAVALLLGKFLHLNSKLTNLIDGEQSKEEVKDRMKEVFSMLRCTDGAACSCSWYKLMREIGLETDFQKLGICSEKDFTYIAESVNPQRLKNHPVPVSRETVLSIFAG